MSVSGGATVAGGNIRRNHRILVDNRFYYPPPMRKYRQKQEPEQEQNQVSTLSENGPGSSSDCSVSSSGITSEISNLCRFLEHTTPHVPAQFFPTVKQITSMLFNFQMMHPFMALHSVLNSRSKKRWKATEEELQPYFVLGDLWESFKEWSAYGAGVPLVLNGNESVTQYYNVSLSAIQLYVDPSKPSPWLRRPGLGSDSESSRETSNDSSSGYCHERGEMSSIQPTLSDANKHGLEGHSLIPLAGSSTDETESCSCDPPGQLISNLAHQIPELNTYWSCDLSPASWVSLAWYPIYRIPTGPTLQSLSACFLTFHSLSTALQMQSPNNDRFHPSSSRGRDISSKISLPIFGLAFQKLQASVWNPDGVSERQKANSLLQGADNWIRLLQVNHPDYNYFVSHYPYTR
ncbi:hypothetical protein RJT34_14641 [Clitoria ternatea]|uniref:Uncharacterized protein n=1 Tax=Clitoria ternatea TaxID=43366 RepID=A0AAN9JRA4_CLITE